jgi:hypothetical protein
VFAMAGTNAVAWAVGAAATHSPLPAWPAYAFGVLAVGGLYCLVASLARRWPFGRVQSVAELLDDYIRRGRDARDRITFEELGPLEAAHVVAEWVWRTANGLHEWFPAIADEFLLAAGDDQTLYGPALQSQTVNAKMAVLAKARKGLGGS